MFGPRRPAPAAAKPTVLLAAPSLASAGNQAVQRQQRAAGAVAGSPLGAEARGRLPAAFGDVSDLRVHTGAGAAAASAALGTSAFTVGRDMYFARGAFNPTSVDGRVILAHEVAHGIQQRDAPVGVGTDASERTRAEDDAERAVETGRAPQLQADVRQAMAFPIRRLGPVPGSFSTNTWPAERSGTTAATTPRPSARGCWR